MDQPPFLELADRLSDPVEPADFPKAILRFRNRRWDKAVGLGGLTDAAWTAQFSRFPALPDNLTEPRAMRYHGHQFGSYNPDLGDGRGFLFAQLKAEDGRWLDLGTKGSGQTPWSRQGDGRLTLKGGVREVLASSYLEAMGVNTSKTFSLVETGEELYRGDEPSPTRSAVMVRLSHSHIRFGTFQRLSYKQDADTMADLIDHVLRHYYPHISAEDTPGKAAAMLTGMTQAAAKMVGQWMATGFVHGVMNTDNFNITGETFDFGPYRFLPKSDPNVTAAYFDHQGLYRFGRQPYQGLWALQQLAGALMLIGEKDSLAEALGAYELAYQESFVSHTLALLGLEAVETEADLEFVATLYAWLTESEISWPQFFFDWFGGALSKERAATSPHATAYRDDEFVPILAGIEARSRDNEPRLNQAYFQRTGPTSLLIDEIEAIWAPIAEKDDWSLYEQKLEDIETLRLGLGLA
ncbi:MAG: YdiU family protein [Pseudomonadota bacterium]